MPAQSNKRLPPLPSDLEIVRGILAAPGRDPRARHHGVTANILAQHLGVKGAARLGRGAMKGSWSGTMSASLRLSPRLRSMVARGLLVSYRENYRYVYDVSRRGREMAKAG